MGSDVRGGTRSLVRSIELREVSLPLVRPFRTSFGEEREKRAILVRAVLSTDGGEVEGWGECVASSDPLYSEEWLEGSWLVLASYLCPQLLGAEPFDDLSTVEQRLGHDDFLDHARLQQRLRTPICLDESIRSEHDASLAIQLGSCRVVNIKPGRVGGVLEAKRVHDVAAKSDVPVWIGGMLETGVGRAANLALAALAGVRFPGDTSASDRYFPQDITEPFVLAADGTMAVPAGPGIGVEPFPDRLAACTVRVESVGSKE